MRNKRILKIVFGVFIILLLLVGAVFAYGYFYYGTIVRTYLIEAINRESKGVYQAEMGDLRLNIIAGNLTIKDFKLIPDTALFRKKTATDTLSPLLFRLKINEFRIRGFGIMELIRNHIITLRRIRFIEPEITVFRMKTPNHKQSNQPESKLLSIPLPKGLTSIHVLELMLDNGKIDYFDCTHDSLMSYSVPVCSVLVKNILIDSAHRLDQRLFNSDDIAIKLEGISFNTKNGLNNISLGEIGVSTGSSSLYVKNFHLKPLFNDYEYSRKLGFQTDRMDVFVSMVHVDRLNIRELLLGGKIKAGLLQIDSLVLDDYRDKRVPRKPGFKPPMPQDALRALKTQLRIDTITLKSAKATYREQVGSEPGIIFFDKMNATLTGLTNDTLLLNAGLVSELKGMAYLMGKGKLNATVRFNFGDKSNAFTFSALLGEINLKEINPMLSKLLPAEVSGGKINKLVIPMVFANDNVATGKLLFYYQGLSINLLDQKKTTWSKIKSGAIKFVANNFVINDNNPSSSGKMRTGTVYFTRDKTKGIINFLWKSTLSGLKSTMGFNSKAQKEIIKHEKQRHK